MILWLLSLLTLLWLVMHKMKRKRMNELSASIPKSKDNLPGIGIALKLIGTTEDMMTGLRGFSNEAMKEGIVKVWLGPYLYFVMVDPVDLEFVLKRCLEKDHLYRFLKTIAGDGTVFASVPIWRVRRKILVSAFTPKIVNNFVRVFSEQSEKLAKSLQSKADQGSLNLWPFLHNYSLDSGSAFVDGTEPFVHESDSHLAGLFFLSKPKTETVMGANLHKMDAHSNRYSYSQLLESMQILGNLICERISHLWLHPDWLYRLFPQYKIHEENKKKLHGFTDQVIRQKRISEAETKLEWSHDNYLKSLYERQTFLELLVILSSKYLGDEKGYTDVQLKEELLTLTVAGIDTSALTDNFAMILLAKYPLVQEKVYQELLEVFGDSDRALVKEDLQKLKYLERVVKETLRLYPPAPFIIRKIVEDTKLPSGRILPAGSGVVVSLWGVHRDPKIWGPDVECFDPDRFLPENYKPIHACSYMPFSNGPRNCVGYQYALMSVKTVLSAVLRRFKVVGEPEKTSTPHIRVKLEVMMKAVDGYQIALERRDPLTTTAMPR